MINNVTIEPVLLASNTNHAAIDKQHRQPAFGELSASNATPHPRANNYCVPSPRFEFLGPHVGRLASNTLSREIPTAHWRAMDDQLNVVALNYAAKNSTKRDASWLPWRDDSVARFLHAAGTRFCVATVSGSECRIQQAQLLHRS